MIALYHGNNLQGDAEKNITRMNRPTDAQAWGNERLEQRVLKNKIK